MDGMDGGMGVDWGSKCAGSRGREQRAALHTNKQTKQKKFGWKKMLTDNTTCCLGRQPLCMWLEAIAEAQSTISLRWYSETGGAPLFRPSGISVNDQQLRCHSASQFRFAALAS